MIIRQLPQDQVILVCSGEDCRKHGAKRVWDAIKEALRGQGLRGSVRLHRTKCMGHCKHAPNVMAYPSSELYSGVKKSDVAAIVAELGTRAGVRERSAV